MRYVTDSAIIATPIGAVQVTGGDTIHNIRILIDPAATARASAPAVIAAAEQLEAWFAGTLHAFDLLLEPTRTLRGQELRQGLIDIGYGQTLSYGALARKLGSGPRAIGQLCARNPFPIVVPCHRILAGSGLGNYSAGAGIATKQWLLDHEQRHRRDQ